MRPTPPLPRRPAPRLARTTGLLGLACLASLLGGASCGLDDELRDDFLGKLGHTSISVYPAVVRRTDGTAHDAASAERVADLLREHSLAQVDVASDLVPLPDPSGRYQADVWKASSQAFAAWVVEHPARGEFALLPEYLIGRDPSGREFAGGIHAFVVDRQGRVVDGVLLNSHHDRFRQAGAAGAEDCARVLVAELKQRWVDERAHRGG